MIIHYGTLYDFHLKNLKILYEFIILGKQRRRR